MSETTKNLPVEKRKISKAEINDLPLIAWEGEIQIVESVEKMEAVAATLAHVHAARTLQSRVRAHRPSSDLASLLVRAAVNWVRWLHVRQWTNTAKDGRTYKKG